MLIYWFLITRQVVIRTLNKGLTSQKNFVKKNFERENNRLAGWNMTKLTTENYLDLCGLVIHVTATFIMVAAINSNISFAIFTVF